jgi:hypothetical protein
MSKRSAPDGPLPQVRFDNRIRFLDVLDLVFARASLSPGMQLFAGFFIALGFLAVLGAVPPDVWVPLLITGLAIGTGIIYLPFTWTTYLAVPELTRETVEADPSGMRIHILDRIVEHPWQAYGSASETDRLFILRSRIVPTQIFTKRGIPPADVDTFRDLLTGAELLTETARQQRRKAVIGFIVGASIAILLPLLFNLLAILVPA